MYIATQVDSTNNIYMDKKGTSGNYREIKR
jgi:hypothetical protein